MSSEARFTDRRIWIWDCRVRECMALKARILRRAHGALPIAFHPVGSQISLLDHLAGRCEEMSSRLLWITYAYFLISGRAIDVLVRCWSILALCKLKGFSMKISFYRVQRQEHRLRDTIGLTSLGRSYERISNEKLQKLSRYQSSTL
jgi:hypothetical protein